MAKGKSNSWGCAIYPIVRSAIVVLIASATSISAGQFTLVEFGTTGLDGTSGGPAPVFGSVFGPATLTFSDSSVSTDGTYSQTYNGSGSASIGSLHAAVSESVTCLSSSCGAYALPFSSAAGSADYEPGVSALVWWNDIITVTPGPGLASLNFVFNVDGTFAQSGSANSSDTSAVLVGESCAATEDLCTGGPPVTPRHITQVPITHNGLVTVSLTPWLLNQPFEYEFILGVTANVIPSTVGTQGFINGNSSSSADFLDTAQLIAVNGVDSHGNIVSGTTITSASGFGLPTEAPEPSTFGVVSVGLLLAALSRVARRSWLAGRSA
jgi:hypothetical protein